MKKLYQDYIDLIKNNYEENRSSAMTIQEYFKKNDLVYHGESLHTLAIPKIYSKDDLKVFQSVAQTTYSIFRKVIKAYMTDPSYRKLFPFSKELEELILLDRGYESPLPIARFDIFYNEETSAFKFCEINTDGTSAMNEDRIIGESFAYQAAHQQIIKHNPMHSFELFDPWVETFGRIYRSYDRAVDHPHVAIVDFLEGVQIAEFQEFQYRFRKAGYSCEICEITDLTYMNGKLLSPSGQQIDVIYRRAVTSDIMKHYDQVQPFIQAVKNHDVCIIGAFCTQIVHNKLLFKVLHEAPTKAILTPEENAFVAEHVPYTNLLDPAYCDLQKVIDSKDRWIIKPLDSYAAHGVYAGIDCSEEEWAGHIHDYAGKDYIYQEYCYPYQTPNIDLAKENPQWKPYINMQGLYIYDGVFSGIYSRLSDGSIISSQYNENPTCSFILE